jgi:hypothetical protein
MFVCAPKGIFLYLFIKKFTETTMKKILLSTLGVAALALGVNAQAYIPNSGFESWGTQTGEDPQPQGWISYNVFTSPLIPGGSSNPTSVSQAGTPDNYQGNYSAKIETVTLVSNPSPSDVPNTAGAMYTGSVALAPPYLFPGYASQQRPQTMTYYTKYTPSGTDTAMAIVAITHWNGMSRDTIAYGIDYIPSAISAYTMRTVALVYDPAFVNTIPDTIAIAFSASGFFNPQVGSSMWVDAVAFSGYVGVDEQLNNAGVSVYPNPSAVSTQFDVTVDNAAQVVVYDMTGREVSRENFNGKVARVNSAALANGSYSYSIISNEAEVLSRGQFAVAH